MQTNQKNHLETLSISFPKDFASGKCFTSFSDANHYLSSLTNYPERLLAFHFAWENGITHDMTLLFPQEEMNSLCIAENALQNSVLQSLLVPTGAKTFENMYYAVNLPSCQMERITITEEEIDRLETILLTCEGMEDESVVSKFELFKRALQKADQTHPLLLSFILRGRALLKSIHDAPTTNYYKKKAEDALLRRYADLIQMMYDKDAKNEIKANAIQNRVLDFAQQLYFGTPGLIDERMSNFGFKIYRLYPADFIFLNSNAKFLEPFTDIIALRYLDRLEVVNQASDVRLEGSQAYASAYAVNARKSCLKPPIFHSHFNASVDTVKELAQKHVAKEDILEGLQEFDPFVPFFPDKQYSTLVFRDAEMETTA